MDHEAESHRVVDSRLPEATEHLAPESPGHPTSPGEMLRQLARQLRTSQTSQLSAKDPYGTTFPGLDDAWLNDDALHKKNAQYFIDLRASMDLSHVSDVVTEDIQVILKRLDKIAAAILLMETNRRVAMKGKGRAAVYAGMLDVALQFVGRLALGAGPVIKLQAWLAQVEVVQGNHAELEVAKYKFAEFVVSLGLLPLAALKRGNATPKDQHGGLPTIQVPAPWQRLLPDWRRFVPTPPMVVAGGPGGAAALDGWQAAPHVGDAPHALPAPIGGPAWQEDVAYEIVMPAPTATTAIAAPPVPTELPAEYREAVKQIFFDYNANVRPDRARLFARLEHLLTQQVGISDHLWARLRKLHPRKLELMLPTKGFLEGASSSDVVLRHYVERLADLFADTDLSPRAFKHYVDTAKALVQVPEATDLQRVKLGGTNAATYSAIVNGEKVFLKMAKDPNHYSSVYNDLQASSDMMKMSPRDAVRWYMLVRVHDGLMGWREAVAMEPVPGDSLGNLSDRMYGQQALPFPIGPSHVRAVRKFQEDARIYGFSVRDEHDGNMIATDDVERPIVPVDMTVKNGNYFVQAAAINPLTIVRELAEYSRQTANGIQHTEVASGPTPQDLEAAEAKLKQLFADYQPKRPRARAVLMSQLREVLNQLGVDDSISALLVPQLDYPQLRTLFDPKGALEGLSSSNESQRMHAEDLAWEYAADRLRSDVYKHAISNAQSVSALPPVVRLRKFGRTTTNYIGHMNGRTVQIKMPLDPQGDSQLDEWVSAHADKHPFLVRVLDPKTRVWRRAAAWYDE